MTPGEFFVWALAVSGGLLAFGGSAALSVRLLLLACGAG